MQRHRAVTLERLERLAARMRTRLYPEQIQGTMTAFAAPDRISYAEAVRGSYKPIALGHLFSPPWSTHWVRFEAAIPEVWVDREVHLRWDCNSEACVWQSGRPLQGLTHGARTEFIVTHAATRPMNLTYYIEVACNQLFGVPQENPHEYRLSLAQIAVFDRDLWNLLWDFAVIAELARHLPADTPRTGQALRIGNDLANAIDLDDRTTWPAAREIANAFLTQRNGEGQHNLSAIGHAHIDTAWLWPLAESRRKCYRTFSTAIRYLREDANYKFVASQAQQYAWIKEMHPELYADIRDMARKGRFIPAGGTWVEPDCNIPSGESLVRQFLVGQRYFERDFGRTCSEFWNPDVFGYSGQLPQIMRGAGIRYFLTQKLSWNQFNQPPAHTFWWEGIDGSRVLTHFPPANTYNGDATIKELLDHSRNYKDHEKSQEGYYLFGFGDGGGGPTPEMLERLGRCGDVDGLPRVEIRSPSEFFARLEEDARDLLVWVGELYFELHRGTYTTQARNKRCNRQCELLLRDLELLLSVAYRKRYPRQELDRLWKLVLLNQFHDIIPGSSIHEVYKDSDEQYHEVLTKGGRLREKVVEHFAGGKPRGTRLLAINTLCCSRREVVELPETMRARGAQLSASGSALAIVTAPAMGYRIAEPQFKPFFETQRATITETTEGYVMENELVRAVIRRDGRLASLHDRIARREAVADGAVGNNLLFFEDTPNNWEAWDVDIFHLEKRTEAPAAAAVRIIEKGPLRVALELMYPLSDHSRMVQQIRLSAVSSRLDFVCHVDWHESQRFLKVEFPWKLRAMQASYEIQFGHLQRPTHANTSWDMARFEVCGHRWADLSEPDFGVALLSDCKYGYQTAGNVMRLSLLRSTKSPDPEADMGIHAFSYAAFPHAGSLQQGGVIEEAARFNSPMLLAQTDKQSTEVTWFDVDNPAVVLDTVKLAEDTPDLILRLYEAHGTHARARIDSTLPIKGAAVCDLLERDQQRLAWSDAGAVVELSPFQIMTIRLRL